MNADGQQESIEALTPTRLLSRLWPAGTARLGILAKAMRALPDECHALPRWRGVLGN